MPLVENLVNAGCPRVSAAMAVNTEGYGMTEAPALLRAYDKLNTITTVPSDVQVCPQCQPGTSTFIFYGQQYKGSCRRLQIALGGRALLHEEAVLCIGAEGLLSYRSAGDFIAVSHVWAHGWQGVSEDGICSRVLDILLNAAFDLGQEWIWLDAALVSGVRDLRVMAVNDMNRVYSAAAATLVCDRLLMAMEESTDREKVLGVAMCDWMTRLWTMQEAVLSSRLVFLEQDCLWTAKDMFETLMDYGDEDPDNHWQLVGAMQTLCELVVESDRPLDRVLQLGSNRRTTKSIDLVRALFPLFDLKWPGPETTFFEAQIILLEHLETDAYRYAWSHAPVGLPSPWTWAPCTIVNCEGYILPRGLPLRVDSQGLHGIWFAAAVELKDIEVGEERDTPAQYSARTTGTFHNRMTFALEDESVFRASVYHNEGDLTTWRSKRLLLLRAPVDDIPQTQELEYYNLVVLDGSNDEEYLDMHRVGSVLAHLSLREFKMYEEQIQGVIS